MHRVFGRTAPRRTGGEEAPPRPNVGPWATRLGAVGRALDASRLELREVAVATAGRETLVAALVFSADPRNVWRRSQWLPLTLAVVGDVVRPVGAEALPAPAGSGGDWAARLGVVGARLDQHPGPVREATVLEVPSGFVVEALARDAATGGWRLTSHEFAAPKANSAPAPRDATGRVHGLGAEQGGAR